MKPLQFKSIDLFKYTELIIDKQPTVPEITAIVQSYVDTVHPTHIALAIPLDENADFLAHGHVPAPLTIDEFTRVWVDAIHKAGVNVYFRGSFCGIKNLYDFGFDKTTLVGSADTAIADGKNTWMGRIYHWLNTNLGHMKQGDIIGIIPEATNNAFNGNFFLPSATVQQQSDFLTFYLELKKLCDTMTAPIKPIYSGFSANVYKDVVNGWIPRLLYDLVGVMSVDYYGDAQTPVEIEKALNDLYTEFRVPVFLSEWSLPPESLITTDINNQAQEFFEAFARLREKGILLGINYFDGIDFTEGIFQMSSAPGSIVSQQGKLLAAFFDQGGKTEPNPLLNPEIARVEGPKIEEKEKKETPKIEVQTVKIEEKTTPKITQPTQTITKTKRVRKKVTPEVKPDTSIETKIVTPTKQGIRIGDTVTGTGDGNYGLHKTDVSILARVAIYAIIGTDATQLTNYLTHSSITNLTPYVMIGYTILVAIAHAILDGK